MSRDFVSRAVHEQLIESARAMRAHPTVAEAMLWNRLRKRRLGGFKFRRQHIIQTFIVDFYCPAVRLVIEGDGDIHKAQREYDQQRPLLLNSLGYGLLRFNNNDVETDIEGVLHEIFEACKQPQP